MHYIELIALTTKENGGSFIQFPIFCRNVGRLMGPVYLNLLEKSVRNVWHAMREIREFNHERKTIFVYLDNE